MTSETATAGSGSTPDGEPGSKPCCDGDREHRYSCPAREWPATATPEVRRAAVRGESIGAAHAKIEDLARGLDYGQRKQLTEILAGVWDDGCGYGSRLRAEVVKTAGDWEKLAGENDDDGMRSGEAEWNYRAGELRSCAASLRMLAADAP